jgi:arylsulfatase A-like enzyme
VNVVHKPPNIVLISLDCVRPDFLGCYGCRTVRTPHLDRMAAQGIAFDQAISQSPNTWVSHAGILTGCYPPRHGLRSPYDAIPDGVPTLASILKGCGYATAGFPGNDLVGSRMGFAQGFDLFFEEYGKAGMPEQESRPPLPGGLEPFHEAHRVTANTRNDWEEVLAAARDWLSEENAPVFLWFHYLDTHHLPDLRLPEYFRFSRDPLWQFYEGKISYADERCVGGVLEILRKRGILEKTLLVVLSDHGEGLWPGRTPRHNGELTEDVIRVPLILFGEHLPVRGVRVASTVTTADLVPTLAARAGGDIERLSDCFSGSPLPLPGRVGSAAGRARSNGHSAYAENEPLGLSCVRTDDWKYLQRGHEAALFHLPSDPGERVNVILRHPETAQELKTQLEQIRSRGPARRQAASRDEQETRRILRSLGYLE